MTAKIQRDPMEMFDELTEVVQAYGKAQFDCGYDRALGGTLWKELQTEADEAHQEFLTTARKIITELL